MPQTICVHDGGRLVKTHQNIWGMLVCLSLTPIDYHGIDYHGIDCIHFQLKTVKTGGEIQVGFFSHLVPNLEEFDDISNPTFILFQTYNRISKICIYHSIKEVTLPKIIECIDKLIERKVLWNSSHNSFDWASMLVFDILTLELKKCAETFNTSNDDFKKVREGLVENLKRLTLPDFL